MTPTSDRPHSSTPSSACALRRSQQQPLDRHGGVAGSNLGSRSASSSDAIHGQRASCTARRCDFLTGMVSSSVVVSCW